MELTIHASNNGGRKGRVLIVDDEAQVRKPICISLTRAGYEVVEAENGEQAIVNMNAADNPLMVDTILCDIRMPKINGMEAIAYFRSQYPGVPVIVLTGYPDVDMAVSLMKQGVHDYLVKPVSKDDLLGVISKTVEGRQLFEGHFTV
jgi:two-component system chemotaxis response regulator CheY